jgi:two-component system KDP operon response regulator KdpE
MVPDSTVQPTDVAGTIILVDGDEDLIRSADEALGQQGFGVYAASDCREGVQYIVDHQPDLVIVDIGAKGSNGTEACRHIRKVSDVPLLMLANQDREEAIVEGLEQGAKDYLIKPFQIGQLVTRARVLLSRTGHRRSRQDPAVYSDDYLAVNVADRRIMVQRRLLQLTTTEYRLLGYMLENAGQVLTYERLLEAVWGRDHLDYPDYVRIYVWRLRKKIERDARRPQYILTEHGIGYRFEKAAAAARA